MRVVGPPVPPARLAQLEAFVSGQRITDAVVQRALQEELEIVDIVWMDEFTYDLVLAVGPQLWLVYDTT